MIFTPRYAGFKINFDDLEFNLFVAGELEMLSSSKISEVEIIGRTKLLKRIAYFTELYEWKGLSKLYAHIKGDNLSISDVVVKANKSVNDHDLVNINDIRKSKSLKAQSKVKQLLQINDSR
jgi:hypothetical protein